jgi:hypothetical protein
MCEAVSGFNEVMEVIVLYILRLRLVIYLFVLLKKLLCSLHSVSEA